MRYRMLCWPVGLGFLMMAVFAFAHEKTGWIAPKEAKNVKNPVKAIKASIQKGKVIYLVEIFRFPLLH